MDAHYTVCNGCTKINGKSFPPLQQISAIANKW